MTTTELIVDEQDEGGNLTATHVQSSTIYTENSSRIDTILPAARSSGFRSIVKVFLPAGYPHSVTEDYLEYQIYDSLQAFSSSIAGLLSSRAVLQGVGVGDASASPTAALLLSVLQDSMGRIATILFAHKLGSSLEPECKMYRLAADILNDTAMILDCLSPALPKVPRVVLLSFSSILRALCGVCAGSSKASLSAHFARWGNLGELNAKDSSQETIISLMGMLAGSIVVSRVSSTVATWSSLILLLSIHLAMNHAAVRAVRMRTMNRQRANTVFSTLFDEGVILSPEEVSKQERIFERDGVLRWKGCHVIGYCRIGVPLRLLLRSLVPRTGPTGSIRSPTIGLSRLWDLYRDEDYLLWYDSLKKTAMVVLKGEASPTSLLKAWSQALLVAHRRHHQVEAVPRASVDEVTFTMLRVTLADVSRSFENYLQRLRTAGWDVNTAALETSSGRRIMLKEMS
ncbi:MAG: hypothetical protein M1830_009939 [Pleopsidium flavum]|nr:MAG: hypothetical protein M1830_009939 [Pleopsidium flavum]